LQTLRETYFDGARLWPVGAKAIEYVTLERTEDYEWRVTVPWGGEERTVLTSDERTAALTDDPALKEKVETLLAMFGWRFNFVPFGEVRASPGWGADWERADRLGPLYHGKQVTITFPTGFELPDAGFVQGVHSVQVGPFEDPATGALTKLAKVGFGPEHEPMYLRAEPYGYTMAINSSAKRVPVRLLDNGVAIIGEMGGDEREYILAAEALRSVLTGTPSASPPQPRPSNPEA
jgi:hypothetical protein